MMKNKTIKGVVLFILITVLMVGCTFEEGGKIDAVDQWLGSPVGEMEVIELWLLVFFAGIVTR